MFFLANLESSMFHLRQNLNFYFVAAVGSDKGETLVHHTKDSLISCNKLRMASTSLLEAQLGKVEDLIKSNPKVDEILTQIETKTKVKKSYQVLAAGFIVVIWLASGHAGQLLCNIIGVLYPSYASIKAIGNLIT